MRSAKLGLSPSARLHPSQPDQMKSQIKQLKNSDSANLSDRKRPLLPRRFGSLNSLSNHSVDQPGKPPQNTNDFTNKRASNGKEDSNEGRTGGLKQAQPQDKEQQQPASMKIPATKLQEINESQSDSIDDEPEIVQDRSQSKEDLLHHHVNKDYFEPQRRRAAPKQKDINYTRLEMSPSSPNFQAAKNLQGLNQGQALDSVSDAPIKERPDIQKEVAIYPRKT